MSAKTQVRDDPTQLYRLPEWAGITVFPLVGSVWLLCTLPGGEPVVSGERGRTMAFSSLT
jgi:hypothetical protein